MNMEKIMAPSWTILYGFPVAPVRTVTSTCTFHASASCLCFAGWPSKKLSFRSQYRRMQGLRSRSSSSLVRKLAISCGVTQIDESQFSDVVLKSDRPVLVEFVANWCGPCRLMAPAIAWVAQEYKEKLLVVKIDHDLNPQLIEEYKVYGLPAFILFKNGHEVPESRREGAITKVKLKEYLDALLDSVSVS